MDLHPKFRVVNISPSPMDRPLFMIEIASSQGPAVRYRDAGFRSVVEAEAAILDLQAKGLLPSNEALGSDAWR